MQTAVVQGLAAPANGVKPTEFVKLKIQKAAKDNNLPSDIYMDVKQNGSNIQARVYYVKPVNVLPFGIYTYSYEFDHTATPVGFLHKARVNDSKARRRLHELWQVGFGSNFAERRRATLSDKRRRSYIFLPPDTALMKALRELFRFQFSKIQMISPNQRLTTGETRRIHDF